MNTYLQLFRHHRRILSFGVLMAFASSFGQTFFISLSAPYLVEAFSLSNAGWGALYSTATLAGACCLPFVGRMLDRVVLVRFSLGVALGMAAASMVLGVSPHVAVVFLALVGLRLTGQGLCGLTSATTMGRSFTVERGSALSVASMGFPLGEILFPPLALLVLGALGWRWLWIGSAGFIVALLIPSIYALLSDHRKLPRAVRETGYPADTDLVIQGWTRAQVFRHYRVYLLLPTYMATGFLATGLIIHQFVIAEQKGWSATVMAGSFVMFGATRLVFGLIAGPLIDRFTATRLYPFTLLPLIGGAILMARETDPWAPSVYYGLMGVSHGLGGSGASALWAELYGVRHLGAIKSLMSTLAILSTAVAPVLLGWLTDRGVTFTTQFLWMAMAMAVATVMNGMGCWLGGKKDSSPDPKLAADDRPRG